jgi:hypothetical protein
MKTQYLRFAPDEEIPALACIRKRKLVKYYTRETLAAVLAVSRLLDGQPADTRTPFYYASADTENFACFRDVFERMTGDGSRRFDAARYLACSPPTAQFKVMRNMVPCFVSIEQGLTGDNNVIVDSASALLYAALTAPGPGPVLIGAGYLHADDSVEVGFALADPASFENHPLLGTDAPAIAIFRP